MTSCDGGDCGPVRWDCIFSDSIIVIDFIINIFNVFYVSKKLDQSR